MLAGFTAAWRDFIRRELDMFFSALPRVVDGFQIKTWRGLATRYDKSPESFEAGLHLKGSIMWLKLLTSTT